MAHSVGGESSSSSDPCNSTHNWKYDVFLSFAGQDTRLKFVDHLDKAFTRSGIKTFKDDVDLERGGVIKQGLFQAIQDSLCAVLVISENYAKSTWCLEELQKILESRKILDQRVFPIFYDVDPADVRHQRKRFKVDEHEDKTKVQNWRNALGEIAGLAGWDTRNKREADLIEKIVGDVRNYLFPKLPYDNDDNLVGIESRADDMMRILEIELDDIRFVGIWGMGGVGKTTLAKFVSQKLSDKFEVRCCLDNVRETFRRNGLVSLQRELLSCLKSKTMEIRSGDERRMIRELLCNKKVLLVLDDLDDISQLKKLVGSPDSFGKGRSRIIITTRDKHLLTSSDVANQRIYEMKSMNEHESLRLFSNNAFKKDHPEENYLELSESIVKYAQGLPLALETLGSFLHRRSKVEWIDAVDRLKRTPQDDIVEKLKISYDGLKNVEEKAIFLDIACFFKGQQKKGVTRILERCGLHPTIGIQVLIEKTLLVQTKDGKLEMHDLLQELGRNIVEQESPNDVGKRSRLWKFEDIKKVLENNEGSEAIEAIFMNKWFHEERDKIEVHPEAFSKMSNIRLLSFSSIGGKLFILPRDLEIFPRALKVVLWRSSPLEALPLKTPLNELVDIYMTCSRIKQLWNDKQPMRNLKSIDLSYSRDFTKTPNFSEIPNLEHLRLSGCVSLVKVDPSLGQLKKLVEVYLDGCENLEVLPGKLETNSLMKLDLSRCEKVAVLPKIGEGLKKLSYLDVSCTAISSLLESLESLTSLRCLNLHGYKILNLDKFSKTHITRQIAGLNVMSLTELYLSWCGLNDGSIPDDFGSLSSLIVLDLSCNDFVNLPADCFSGLSRLVFLSLEYCKRLKSLPRLPPRLIRLDASKCESMERLSSDRQLWNLVGSLDHECCGRTKYESYDNYEDYYPFLWRQLRLKTHKRPHPLRDFYANIPGDEMPSWFPNKEYYECRREYYSWKQQYEIKVDIPPDCRDSKWCRIVVCLLFSGDGCLWISKAAEDDDYIRPEWEHSIVLKYGNQCIMVLELNEETHWKHLTPHHSNSLHIQLSTESIGIQIRECGWRVICKEEIQQWRHLNHFNLLTASPPHDDVIKLSERVRQRFHWY